LVLTAVKTGCGQNLPTLLLTAMVNALLCEGHLPVSQKKAVVTPLLKKSSSDVDDLKNYRPVSNLSFVSKLVERAAIKQLVDYLEVSELMPKLQSAYTGNITEPRLLCCGSCHI